MVRTVEPWHMKSLEKNIERWENCIHDEPAIFVTLFGDSLAVKYPCI